MNIALINPNRDIKDAAVHLGLGYIASYARTIHKDLTFNLLDTRISSKSRTTEFLNNRYNLVGITASSQVFSEAVEIASAIKEKFPGTPICLGGAHASTYREEALAGYPFDYIAIGEGEITFSEIIGLLKGTRLISEISGLIYKDLSGSIITNASRELISDIDLIPIPAYDLFDLHRYPQHRMVTSRGCPFNCVFCNSSTIWTNRWRKRTTENLILEIELLTGKYGRKTIVLNDDSFNIDPARVISFCDRLIESRLNILWSASVRVDLVTREVAEKMKKAGCYNVSIGIESANNIVLDRINKKTTREKILSGITTLRETGVDVMGQFMIGNPGDTLETVKESIEFAASAPLTGVEFYTALPYKGSLLWDFVASEGKMLTSKQSFEYHNVTPRIIFETREFSANERLMAINLAIEKGFYNALSTDRKAMSLDIGRRLTLLLQRLSGRKAGNWVYLKIRSIYNLLFR